MKKTAAVLVAIVLVFIGMTTQYIQTTHVPRVAVIGAGLAGLTAAYRLKQHGYDVALYEARGRVGGRVLSIIMDQPDGTQTVAELGGENINNGGKAAHMRAIINELQLSLHSLVYEGFQLDYYREAHKIPIQELLQRACSMSANELWDRLEQLKTTSATMQDVLQQLFSDFPDLEAFFSIWLASYEGGDVAQLSSSYITTLFAMIQQTLHQSSDSKGEMLTVEGGNSILTERLEERLGNSLHLNHALSGIIRNDSDSYNLAFTNGTTVTADIVILAMPCSVYKDIAWGRGTISEQRLHDLCNVRYGQNAKILLPVLARNVTTSACTDGTAIGWTLPRSNVATLYYFQQSSHFNK